MKQSITKGLNIYNKIRELKKEVKEIAIAKDELNDNEHKIAAQILYKTYKEKSEELNRLEQQEYYTSPKVMEKGAYPFKNEL